MVDNGLHHHLLISLPKEFHDILDIFYVLEKVWLIS